MFRLLFRIIGLLLAAAGLVGIVVDGTKSIAAHAFVTTPLGETWASLSADSLTAVREAITSHGLPFLWDPILTSILALPNWLVLSVLGYGLIVLTTPRRPKRKHITV